MILRDIILDLKNLKVVNYNDNLDIESVNFDSRLVKNNSCFVATKGLSFDGHQYIEEAINKGAKVIVCQDLPNKTNDNICYILVENSNNALSKIAANYHNNPSKKLIVVGVTGTNGKTTIATLLFDLFTNLGFKCGLLSTIELRIGDKKMFATHTTPDALAINNTMKQMVDDGCKYCFMEVSSHSLEQYRVNDIDFKGAIFTNITHDHLDYHKTFMNYLNSKKKFFDMLDSNSFALSNVDDKNGKIMMQNTKAKKLTYALHNMADYRLMINSVYKEGMNLKIDNSEVFTYLNGQFNAYNLLAVYAAAKELGINDELLKIEISKLKAVSGRFQMVYNFDKTLTAVIDYAHTPDALEKLLIEVKSIFKDSKIIIVVGCGGNRDKEKRPLMANIATRYAHKVILSSDNPRNESPIEIINDMKKGLDGIQIKNTLTVIDRREAINTGFQLMGKNDVIVIAGKGHEKYQEINNEKFEFDDVKIIEEFFK